VGDYIKDYWESQAKIHGTSHAASWGDNFMIDLEVETISQYLQPGDHVLDIGCSNGYSAFRQLELQPRLGSLIGCDFSEAMIDQANRAKKEKGLDTIISFDVGDIRSINFSDNVFDVVYTTRVIINVPTWEQQKRSIDECVRVAKPGGLVIFCEAFWEPLMLLNAIRILKQLPPLVEHDFNRYLKKSALEAFLNEKNIEFFVNEFSSVYYLGSRFLRELITDHTAYPGFTNPINQKFYELEREYSGGGFGIQQAYILRKGSDR
jgi:ubiquinone/menaquinone biosynthesis C-methylase UbiE